jgi:hypothetical protein
MLGEKIVDGDDKVVGNVEGMTVSLNSTDFNNKRFEDFTLVPDVAGNAVFTAKISDQIFTLTINAAELNEGAALRLAADNGDFLILNIGKSGLKALAEPQNYQYIGAAIKKALMSEGIGLDLRVGLTTEDTTKVRLSDLSVNKLYRDDKDEYIPKFSLVNEDGSVNSNGVKQSREVVTNALSLVRSAQSSLAGEGESVDSYTKALTSAIGITKDASASYLDTDLVQAASNFAAALKSVYAAIYTLRSGDDVTKAALRIIQTIK